MKFWEGCCKFCEKVIFSPIERLNTEFLHTPKVYNIIGIWIYLVQLIFWATGLKQVLSEDNWARWVKNKVNTRTLFYEIPSVDQSVLQFTYILLVMGVISGLHSKFIPPETYIDKTEYKIQYRDWKDFKQALSKDNWALSVGYINDLWTKNNYWKYC